MAGGDRRSPSHPIGGGGDCTAGEDRRRSIGGGGAVKKLGDRSPGKLTGGKGKGKARKRGRYGSDGALEGRWEAKSRGNVPKGAVPPSKEVSDQAHDGVTLEASQPSPRGVAADKKSGVNVSLNPIFVANGSSMEVEVRDPVVDDWEDMEAFDSLSTPKPGLAVAAENGSGPRPPSSGSSGNSGHGASSSAGLDPSVGAQEDEEAVGPWIQVPPRRRRQVDLSKVSLPHSKVRPTEVQKRMGFKKPLPFTAGIRSDTSTTNRGFSLGSEISSPGLDGAFVWVMVEGDRRSPPRHPSARSGGGKDVRGGKKFGSGSGRRDGVKNVAGGNIMGVSVGSISGDGSERRFSLPGLGGLADMGAGGSGLVYSWSLSRAGSTRSGGFEEVLDAGKELVSSKELEMEVVSREQGMASWDESLQGSSDRDEVMDILGGSEAEDFLKDVVASMGSADQLEIKRVDTDSGFNDDCAVDVKQDGMLEFEETMHEANDCVGEDRSFDEISHGDMSIDSQQAGELESDARILNAPVEQFELIRRDRDGLDCNDTINNDGCTPGVCGIDSTAEFPSIQSWKTPVIARKVGHRADLCKETCYQPKQQELMKNVVQKQDGSVAAELGLGGDLGSLKGVNDPGSGINVGSLDGDKSSFNVDVDHGEWTIITRKEELIIGVVLSLKRVLKFSGKKSCVLKEKNKRNRDFNEQRMKVMGNFSPLQKMPGIRRSLKEGLASSSNEQCVNVIDNSVDCKLKDVDFVEQWQSVFSEFFYGRDASPLVDNV
ncbi:hypothetical protein MA16_Dca027323 [Dendrobium catenatum]|uniref:Uncharacterized protein n=1 Tax=Dendrobium catenatum TaxID=906689 RepID=A0A2I0X9W1_9ASPA|nr:hypothetical protein MA16_Dca027323 [Dendrobium catenatum]